MQVKVQSKYIIDKIFLFMNKVIGLFHDIIHTCYIVSFVVFITNFRCTINLFILSGKKED